MAKEKPGVMVYWETFDVLESLVDGDAKAMMSAIRQYSQYGVLPDFTGNAILTTLWLLIRPKLDADSERYERIRDSRVEAGRKGGLARASNAKQIQANEANATFAKQIKPTTSTSTTTTATTTTTAETTPETVLRDKGEGIREKGRDLTIPSPCTDSDNALGFEEHRRRSIEEFKAEVERRKREAGQ